MLFLTVGISAQTVTNVVAKQKGDQVEITYDVDRTAEISLLFSTDGGLNYDITPKVVSGDVGVVGPGHHRMVWHMLAEQNEWDVMRARFKVVSQKHKGVLKFVLKDVNFDMVLVEGGSFEMGGTSDQGKDVQPDEKPVHTVELSDYYIGKTEVTQALWEAVMGSNPSIFKDGNNPVELVTWDDCQKFVSQLNSMLSSQLFGMRFALPTEAQWEYAARGGQKSEQNMYSGANKISSVAWYDKNSVYTTHNVAGKKPNELGIYDMTGNVNEWCQDVYGKYTMTKQNNPTGLSEGSDHVCRGGSWFNAASFCRISCRKFNKSDKSYTDVGLRLVLIP